MTDNNDSTGNRVKDDIYGQVYSLYSHNVSDTNLIKYRIRCHRSLNFAWNGKYRSSRFRESLAKSPFRFHFSHRSCLTMNIVIGRQNTL